MHNSHTYVLLVHNIRSCCTVCTAIQTQFVWSVYIVITYACGLRCRVGSELLSVNALAFSVFTFVMSAVALLELFWL